MGINLTGKLILASASPRRSELLKFLGLDFSVLPSDVPETPLAGETQEKHVLRLATEKANALACQHAEAWVIGADTIVYLDGEILGKPSSRPDARQMLAKLSGRVHRVYTGFAVVCLARNVSACEVVESAVSFKDISAAERDWYVHTDEPYDKAGGYALQGSGAFFVREVQGSYTNVIGLPLCEVISMLQRLGALEFSGSNK